MKKLIFSLFMVLGIAMIIPNNAQAQKNMTAQENRAVAALNSCVQQYRQPGIYKIEVTLASQGRCLDGGTANTYNVIATSACEPAPNVICIAIADILLGKVSFDCDGKITSAICY